MYFDAWRTKLNAVDILWFLRLPKSSMPTRNRPSLLNWIIRKFISRLILARFFRPLVVSYTDHVMSWSGFWVINSTCSIFQACYDAHFCCTTTWHIDVHIGKVWAIWIFDPFLKKPKGYSSWFCQKMAFRHRKWKWTIFCQNVRLYVPKLHSENESHSMLSLSENNIIMSYCHCVGFQWTRVPCMFISNSQCTMYSQLSDSQCRYSVLCEVYIQLSDWSMYVCLCLGWQLIDTFSFGL